MKNEVYLQENKFGIEEKYYRVKKKVLSFMFELHDDVELCAQNFLLLEKSWRCIKYKKVEQLCKNTRAEFQETRCIY